MHILSLIAQSLLCSSGTEIGGSFLSSTLIQENVPAMFSSPVLGSQFLLQDTEEKHIKGSSFEKEMDGSNSGELVLVPPSVGLSTTLLNRDHFTEYYEGMPSGPDGELLRRHGDEIEYVRSSIHLSKEDQNSTTPYFRALGRSDDTMNIGGKDNYFWCYCKYIVNISRLYNSIVAYDIFIS